MFVKKRIPEYKLNMQHKIASIEADTRLWSAAVVHEYDVLFEKPRGVMVLDIVSFGCKFVPQLVAMRGDLNRRFEKIGSFLHEVEAVYMQLNYSSASKKRQRRAQERRPPSPAIKAGQAR